ncbi:MULTISPECIES: M57 family metalloprotease [unclassified Corallococcus]|uniref:M57 family metalloprotease n=1 Tax=unclassified Corallococcus TaxID=2685029 RepID=UPI001A90069A|nr:MULTISPECIES: M57 family metalloprotease [unclassified Corallococcus]MBN9685622.1 hypothetical protein [Corallococcus sp. NCSPR001]WAS82932.1 M57 family metalloprotease [Corallococcus sp. NCRR]
MKGIYFANGYNRATSCGIGGNEGDAGVDATHHVPGSPITATTGGFLMNSCFR